MSSIQMITADNFSIFAERVEIDLDKFIPMLPFVKTNYHNFDRYKTYSDKGIYLIDNLDNGEYCLYHLYHLDEGDDTLRITFILPSSWERRVQIVEKSFSNFIKWFREEDSSEKFMIQILEYGEFQLLPTLSHYIIPTLLKNQFETKYKMYMRRDRTVLISSEVKLAPEFTKVEYNDGMLDEIIDFYYNNHFENYLINCSEEEVREFSQTEELFKKSAMFIKNKEGKIVAGIFSTKDDGSVIYPGSFWMENFAVHSEYDDQDLGKYLLSEQIKLLASLYPDQDAIAYISREYRKAVRDYEFLNFVPFEFWVDAILEK